MTDITDSIGTQLKSRRIRDGERTGRLSRQRKNKRPSGTRTQFRRYWKRPISHSAALLNCFGRQCSACSGGQNTDSWSCQNRERSRAPRRAGGGHDVRCRGPSAKHRTDHQHLHPLSRIIYSKEPNVIKPFACSNRYLSCSLTWPEKEQIRLARHCSERDVLIADAHEVRFTCCHVKNFHDITLCSVRTLDFQVQHVRFTSARRLKGSHSIIGSRQTVERGERS